MRYPGMPDTTSAAQHTGATPLLQSVGLTKRYGSFLANDKIDLDIRPLLPQAPMAGACADENDSDCFRHFVPQRQIDVAITVRPSLN